MMNILTHNFMQKCKSANFKTLKYVDFCAVFHRSIFGVSSGYLRGIFGIKRKLILCIKETTVWVLHCLVIQNIIISHTKE